MAGNKTHEQQIRIIEHREGPNVPAPPRDTLNMRTRESAPPPVEHHGTANQEDRDHNKHNDPGQAGHKPQRHHSPEEEKR